MDSKGQVYSLLTNIKLEIWIHCVCQVPDGSGVKLQRTSIYSLPNSLSSIVVVVKLLQNRALLVWQVQGLCYGLGAAYQAVLDSCREPGAGSGQAVC